MLALFIAYALQLDQPYWAGMSVWMVMQPTPGMAISKGLYRVIGSIIGSIMGVALIALFPQQPELFLLALALWMGGTTVLSNLLTNFRSYASVLAGYTAAIVALGAYDRPNQVFDIAMARGAATIIGITCSTLIMDVTAPHRARLNVLDLLRRAIATTARRAAFPLEGSFTDRIALGRPLVADLIKLDTEIEFASAESAVIRVHAGRARSLVAHLFSAIAAKRALETHLGRVGLVQDPATVALYRESMQLLESFPALLTPAREAEFAARLADLGLRLRASDPEESPGGEARRVSSRLVLDRLADLTHDLERTLVDIGEIERGDWKRQPALQLNFHRDHLAAAINGLRVFFAVILAGAFWIASAWPSGSFMLIQFAVGCGLFSTAPHPENVAMSFLKGVVTAVVASYVCSYYFLTQTNDFIPFALAHAVFLIPGAMLQLNPRLLPSALAYCVFFIINEQPVNPMVFDALNFFNNALATIVGGLFSSMAFILFIPANPRLARRYVILRMRQELRQMAESEPIPPAWQWQTRNFDRVNRLANPSNPAADLSDEWYEGGLGALHLGDEVLRLRRLLLDGDLPDRARALAQSAIGAFDQIIARPAAAIAAVHAVYASLQETAPTGSLRARQDWCRLRGIIGEMEAYFVEYPNFFLR